MENAYQIVEHTNTRSTDQLTLFTYFITIQMDQEHESKIEKLHIFCSQMEEKHNHMLETE